MTPEPPEPDCRACGDARVLHDTRWDVLVDCPECKEDRPVFEVKTDGFAVVSLYAARQGNHVNLSVRTVSGFSRRGQRAGMLIFNRDQRDAFVWVACKLAGEDLVSEKTAPFTPEQIEELFA